MINFLFWKMSFYFLLSVFFLFFSCRTFEKNYRTNTQSYSTRLAFSRQEEKQVINQINQKSNFFVLRKKATNSLPANKANIDSFKSHKFLVEQKLFQLAKRARDLNYISQETYENLFKQKDLMKNKVQWIVILRLMKNKLSQQEKDFFRKFFLLLKD